MLQSHHRFTCHGGSAEITLRFRLHRKLRLPLQRLAQPEALVAKAFGRAIRVLLWPLAVSQSFEQRGDADCHGRVVGGLPQLDLGFYGLEQQCHQARVFGELRQHLGRSQGMLGFQRMIALCGSLRRQTHAQASAAQLPVP